MADITLGKLDKSNSVHSKDKWDICFKLSEVPDAAWIRILNLLTDNQDIQIYGRVEIRSYKKLLCTTADGSYTHEQIKAELDKLVEDVNAKDNAMD